MRMWSLPTRTRRFLRPAEALGLGLLLLTAAPAAASPLFSLIGPFRDGQGGVEVIARERRDDAFHSDIQRLFFPDSVRDGVSALEGETAVTARVDLDRQGPIESFEIGGTFLHRRTALGRSTIQPSIRVLPNRDLAVSLFLDFDFDLPPGDAVQVLMVVTRDQDPPQGFYFRHSNGGGTGAASGSYRQEAHEAMVLHPGATYTVMGRMMITSYEEDLEAFGTAEGTLRFEFQATPEPGSALLLSAGLLVLGLRRLPGTASDRIR